jgi:hypothetical protein
MTLPDLYVLGAPKAGTTSLCRWMAARPDIHFSEIKEPVYWASDYPRLQEFRGFGTRALYESLFASSEAKSASIRAEGSTVYLYSEHAVPRIIKEVPDAKFIVALRNPVDLIVSFHRTQQLLLNEEEADFEKAWRRHLAGKQPTGQPLDPKLLDYTRVGRLGSAVERLLATVARDRVLFITFDDLVRDAGLVWASVTAFLGIPVAPIPDFTVHNASSRIFRSKLLQRLRERPPAALEEPVRRVTHWSRNTQNVTVRRLKRKLWWRDEPRPHVSDEVKAELADYFAEDVRLLSGLVGKDFSHWVNKYRTDDADVR